MTADGERTVVGGSYDVGKVFVYIVGEEGGRGRDDITVVLKYRVVDLEQGLESEVAEIVIIIGGTGGGVSVALQVAAITLLALVGLFSGYKTLVGKRQVEQIRQ